MDKPKLTKKQKPRNKQPKNELKLLKNKYIESFKHEQTNSKSQEIRNNFHKKNNELRKQYEKQERLFIQKKIEKIKNEGIRGNTFWKIRKKLLKSQNEEITETYEEDGEDGSKGKKIEGKEKELEHIANFYENLYKVREPNKEYIKFSQKTRIENIEKDKHIRKNVKHTEISKNEFELARKTLKSGKSTSLDKITNEFLKNLNEQNTEQLKEILNNLLKNGEIPYSWTQGTITRIYKGKGKKGQCSNSNQ